MFHVYLLVSLFSVFSTEPAVLFDTRPQTNLEVRFNSTPQLNVGDPVLFNGAVVGNVARVTNFQEMKIEEGPSVSIRLNAQDIPSTESLVGLVGSLKVANGNSTGVRSFLQLMEVNSPTAAVVSEELKGFGSFEEFWSTKNL